MALDLTTGGDNALPEVSSGRIFTISKEIDCSQITVPSDGVVQAIAIPAGTIPLRVRTQVLTAEGSVLDIDVGDGDTVNRYGDALDGNDATVDNVAGSAIDYVYPNNDTIDVMFKADGTDNPAQPSTVKVKVTAVLLAT